MFDEEHRAMKEAIIELRKQGKILEAESLVDKCLSTNPDDRYMLIDKGHCYMERQNCVRALDCYKRAWELGAQIPYVGRMILKCLKDSGMPMTKDVVPVVLMLKENSFGFKKFSKLIRDYYEASGDETVREALPRIFENSPSAQKGDANAQGDRFSVVWTEADEEYRFIDIDRYNDDLQAQIESLADTEGEEHANGVKYALELGKDFVIPYLRTEIEKANYFLYLLGSDPELNADDISFYSGYIVGLKAAIETQKKYAVHRASITVNVLDLLSSEDYKLSLSESIELNGVFDISVNRYSDVAQFRSRVETAHDEMFVCFCGKNETSKVRDMIFGENKPIEYPVFICCSIGKKSDDAERYISKLAKSKYILLNRDTDYLISEDWLVDSHADAETDAPENAE